MSSKCLKLIFFFGNPHSTRQIIERENSVEICVSVRIDARQNEKNDEDFSWGQNTKDFVSCFINFIQ